MGAVINVLKNDSREERVKQFTRLFAQMISERERNYDSLHKNNLQKETEKI